MEFFLTDDLGSVRSAITNQAGAAIIKSYMGYGPFGFLQYHAGQTGTSKGYTGQYNDPLSGLDYYVARYYDPVVGLFLSADMVQSNLLDFDPYAYVGENPETLTDPTGHGFWANVDQGLLDAAVLSLTIGVIAVAAVVLAPILLPAAVVGGVVAVAAFTGTLALSTGIGIASGMVAGGLAYETSKGFRKPLNDPGMEQAMGIGGLSGGIVGAFGGGVDGVSASAGFAASSSITDTAVTNFGWGLVRNLAKNVVGTGVIGGLTKGAFGKYLPPANQGNSSKRQVNPDISASVNVSTKTTVAYRPPTTSNLPGVSTHPAGSTSTVPGTTFYTIASGDTLWGIAALFYGAGSLWSRIYQANRGTIGGNPNLIYAGERLAIPR